MNDLSAQNSYNHKNHYKKNHCWQYDVRIKNLDADVKQSGLSQNELQKIKVDDFTFQFVSKEEKEKCREIVSFIKRHEWLGKMPLRPTHRFTARYKGQLAGVIVMATPNAFSNLLGKENRDLEKLISRGACISWAPKNLNSALLMYAVRWMAKNTSYKCFTGYSDIEAKELGTIYQACNFMYLGQKSGARYEYFAPNNPQKGWFTDRYFRKISQYKRYAKKLGFKWEKNWSKRDNLFRENIPSDILEKIKLESKQHQKRCLKRKIPKKHKYAYILGKDKRETKLLLKIFLELNPKLTHLSYPKQRGM